MEGPLDQGFLLPRAEIAERQALYLRTLVGGHGYELSEELNRLLVGIMGFVGSVDLTTSEPDSVLAFVSDGLGEDPDPDLFAQWREVDKACREILRPRVDLGGPHSAPETPSLLVPYLQDASVHSVTETLHEYQRLLEGLVEAADAEKPTFADDFLNSLADYGNHYDLIIATKVPLDEPFLVKYTERRGLKLSKFRNKASQELVVADAQTNHVTFRVLDPSTEIVGFEAKSVQSGSGAFGSFVARQNSQTKSFYAFGDDREYRVRLEFRLALLRRLQVVPAFVFVILALAIAALWNERPSNLSDLTLLVGLSALAASVLYAREPSTLGSRLRFLSSIAVASAVAALVVSAVILYLLGPQQSAPAASVCQDADVRSLKIGDCHGEEHWKRFPSGGGFRPFPGEERVGHLG